MPANAPHLVVMMADHLRRDCLSCYGELPVQTPHLDAFSREAVIFDRAYCAAPLCKPTRVSMYTGQWPHNHGVLVNGGSLTREFPYATLAANHPTLYEHLDRAGYAITHIGVQHCHADPLLEQRVPRAHINDGWQRWEREMKAAGKDLLSREVREHRRPCPDFEDGKPIVRHFPTPKAVKRYEPGLDWFPDWMWAGWVEEAIAALDPSRPQFIEALFWAPHPPLVVPEPYWSMYPPDNIPLPETVGMWCEGQPATLLHQFCGHMGSGLTRDEFRPAWSAYLGLVTLVDACIGRVIAALKRKGIWDNALVMYLQDHGEMLGCHALWEKNCCYEEAAHIPWLVKPPGGGTGRRRQLIGHVDFANTLCDYAGAERLPGSQGRSLRPVIEKDSAEWRDATFIEYHGNHGRGTPIRAVVADIEGGQFKYIYNPGDRDELYDLVADPLEKQSLATSASHQRIRKALCERLSAWMIKTGDYLKVEAA
jgi:choline-sulfatase